MNTLAKESGVSVEASSRVFAHMLSEFNTSSIFESIADTLEMLILFKEIADNEQAKEG